MRGVAPAGQLVDGDFGAGVEYDVRRDGSTLDVDLRAAPSRWFAPWNWSGRGPMNWDFAFNGEVALDLWVESGMGEARLDLSELRVTHLTLQTGLSSTDITLPANAGHTRVKIRAGLDEGRFPRSGDVHQSPDYDKSERKVEIDATTGMGALKIM